MPSTSDAAVEIALLARLLRDQTTNLTQDTERFVARYRQADWVTVNPRGTVVTARANHLKDLEGRLTAIYPSWREDFPAIKAAQKNPGRTADVAAWLRRQTQAPAHQTYRPRWASRPGWNRHTWNAAQSFDPKRARAADDHGPLIFDDWVLRLRLIGATTLRFSDGPPLSLGDRAREEGECLIAERRLTQCLGWGGIPPSAILTCENLGAYMDVSVPPGVIVAYCPGNDRRGVTRLLALFPDTPWGHFGDLDQEGCLIAQRIAAEAQRPLRLYIPMFAQDLVAAGCVAPVNGGNAWTAEIATLHPVLQTLAHQEQVLYQEVFLPDPRLPSDLTRFLGTMDGK